MDSLKDALHWLLDFVRNPGPVVASIGYAGMLLVIFIETGLLFPILPGDSLLVVAGIYAAQGTFNVGLLILIGSTQPLALAATVIIRLTTLWFAVALGLLALVAMLRIDQVPEQSSAR